MNNKWDLDSIDYHINWFTSSTIAYKKHGSSTVHKMKVKIKLLEYLFMNKNIHNETMEMIEGLREVMKKENMLATATNYYKSIV
ncbi:hypothetical protein ACDN41_11700 [Priestia aryabhattai]|uniref:hypothetical protein n=1 Tax=Priestia aryabhattai TaxID=412384 RepID=UPI003531BEED